MIRIFPLNYQSDLGFQMKTVNKVMIQGRSSWYEWITGFHLYYSDDGQRWTGYSESGDKTHSNVGRILNGQCRQF